MPSLLLAAAALLLSCGEVTPEPLLQKTSPRNGETAVSTTVRPVIEMGGGVSIDATPPRVVLYDVSGVNRVQVGGTVEVKGGTLTYTPDQELEQHRRLVLEVRQGAISEGDFTLLDITEAPDEPINWERRWWEQPGGLSEGTYQLRFSTLSHPRVASAYQRGGRIYVRFSQPMDRVTTGKVVQLLDATTKEALTLTRKVWPDTTRIFLEPAAPLADASLYVLKVGAEAVGEDSTYLDGNDNGKPGESSDDFCAKFTGHQTKIFSRMGTSTIVPCP